MGQGWSIKRVLMEAGSQAEIRSLLANHGEMSRQELAEELCWKFQLIDARGRLRTGGCLKALRELAGSWGYELPEPANRKKRQWQPKRLGAKVAEAEGVPERADQIKGLELIPVRVGDSKLMPVWNELIAGEHELGSCRAVGRQLRYLVRSEHGWLGAIGFSSAALRLQDREQWIGWSLEQRGLHLERIVNLSRLLIRRQFRCQNLASRVLSQAAKQVVKDYRREYGIEPWLLESFVDVARYDGSSFRSANWVKVGRSAGRGRNDRRHEQKQSVKDVYVYVLRKDFREAMGVPLPCRRSLRVLQPTAGVAGEDWGKQELAGARLGDQRRVERLIRIVEQQGENPGQSYAQAAGGIAADIKAYYRLMDSRDEALNFLSILAPHREQSERRMMSQPRVLVIQDTTGLNFGGLKKTQGLGRIGANQTRQGTLGLNLHSALAVSEEGVPLGVLAAECPGSEQSSAPRQSRHRNCLPMEKKKSGRWLRLYQETLATARRMPGVQVISVMDREADIYDLFQEAVDAGNRVPVLVRLQHDRRLAEEDRRLVESLQAQPADFELTVQISRQRARTKQGKFRPGMRAREAQLQISYRAVTILAPQTALKKRLPPVTLSAVYAREKDAPARAEPIEWILLTTLPVTTPPEAAACIRYYRCRWRIEEFHRVLKSGCRVERHQMETAEHLRRVIAIDLLIAWRIMLLVLLGRTAPELSCELYFSQWEWEALCLAVKNTIPTHPPLLGDALSMVAKLAGYRGRKQDGPPGMQTIWKGMLQLSNMAFMYERTRNYQLCPAPT